MTNSTSVLPESSASSSSPSSSPSSSSRPIPIPNSPNANDAATRAAAQGVILSPTQVHRRASLSCWPPSTSPPTQSFVDYRRSTVGSIKHFSPTMYGCSPDQHSPIQRSPFAHNFSMSVQSHSHSHIWPPSPPSSNNSPPDRSSYMTAPASEVVMCDHHHHRRQSVAVKFKRQDSAIVDDAKSYMVIEQHPRERRLSGHFARPPSPTGERILKGEISF
ncbi:hypothetical protein V1512DRAFT_257349 [Lipomyces arxii]|uniref:uncharacterized protein n=1 Tax=Lipomyces arxii TaxID=56418 RepID=UPI0034CDD54A